MTMEVETQGGLGEVWDVDLFQIPRIPGHQHRHYSPAHLAAPPAPDRLARTDFSLHSPGLNHTPPAHTGPRGTVPGEEQGV